MMLSIAILIIGFYTLIKCANILSNASVDLALKLNISPLLVGILILGFGSSLPEIMVSTSAALDDNTAISVGNVIGSNIFNIALVLGVSALISPIFIDRKLFTFEWPYLFALTIGIGWIIYDLRLSQSDGVLLLIVFTIFIIGSITRGIKSPIPNEETTPENLSKSHYFKIIGSLILLIISAEAIVWSGEKIAILLNVPDLIIGITIIALGTSLPELTLSIASALKRQHQMIIGNIIGSNVFNSALILAIPALINPSVLQKEIWTRDYPYLLLFTALLLPLSWRFKKPFILNRLSAAILLILVVAYLLTLL